MLQLKRSLLVFAALSLLCGLVYPLAMTGVSRIVFSDQANASVVKKGNEIIGSLLIGQEFVSPAYFHGRPSTIDTAYDASNSGGSNLAPTNARLIEQVKARISKARRVNGLPIDSPVPADLVLASASGLDPHISPSSALLQSARIAKERNVDPREIKKLIERNTEQPLFRVWGKERINVLRINLALDGIKIKE